MKKRKLIFILYSFLILLFVELLSYFFLTIKDDTTFPNYNFGKRTHYLDIDEKFGAWHIPNSKYKHNYSNNFSNFYFFFEEIFRRNIAKK